MVCHTPWMHSPRPFGSRVVFCPSCSVGNGQDQEISLKNPKPARLAQWLARGVKNLLGFARQSSIPSGCIVSTDDTGHRAGRIPSALPTQGGFRKEICGALLCQAGLRGHLTYHPCLHEKPSPGCLLSLLLQEMACSYTVFGVLERDLLASSGPQRV